MRSLISKEDTVKNKFFINEFIRFANIVLALHTSKSLRFSLSRIRKLHRNGDSNGRKDYQNGIFRYHAEIIY